MTKKEINGHTPKIIQNSMAKLVADKHDSDTIVGWDRRG
jgi:hypothetical protein